MSLNDFYYTADLALAAALALWYPIESIDKKANPRKAEFCFKRTHDLDQFIESYWKSEVRVEPQMYFSQLRILKARLYASE